MYDNNLSFSLAGIHLYELKGTLFQKNYNLLKIED